MKILVFVDVDGTIIDHDDNPRPYVWEFFYYLKNQLDCYVIAWSAGGADYAERKMGMISRILNVDLESFVDSYEWKADMKKITVSNPRFYIDDAEGLLDAMERSGHGIFKVPFYNDSTMKKDDRWLLQAADAVEQFINARNSETTPSDNGDQSQAP